MLANVSIVPVIILAAIVLAAVLSAVLILISPIVSIALAILFPLIVAYVFGIPVSSVLILFVYEIAIIGILYFLTRRKFSEISEW
jgi:hypothetical protein|tara:strand:- start:274 stop:528 length:255 start_codon:yes stop_codon:yes gene_type:complete